MKRLKNNAMSKKVKNVIEKDNERRAEVVRVSKEKLVALRSGLAEKQQGKVVNKQNEE